MTFIEGTIVKSRRSQKQIAISAGFSVGEANSAGHQLPLSASLRGNDLETYVCYTRKFFLVDGVIGLALRNVQLSDIVTAGSATSNSQIFHQAVLSFAIIAFGAQHGQAHVTGQGYSMYGVALKQLNQALADSKCFIRDEVILSVVTLALLECWVPTGPKHYLKHMIGLEKLLELRGPGSYSPNSSELYKGVRHMILFASLRTGSPSILARAEWKAVLRANCSSEEMQEQDLFDVLADCTVLVKERDNILTDWKLDLERSANRRDETKRKARALLTCLHAWRRRWGSDERNSHSERSANLISPRQGVDWERFPTVFEFSDESVAIMFMFYNTVLIYVLRVLASLTPESSEIPSNRSFKQGTMQDAGDPNDLRNDTKDEYITAERLGALEICRCIPLYLVQKESAHPPAFQLAVTTSWTTLGGKESAEGRWMTDFLNTTRKNRELVAKGLWEA